MVYRHAGRTGWSLSSLSYGCMRFADEPTTVEAIGTAIELGVNYFDVAPLYGGGTAEPWLAHGIRGRREGLIVTAKSSPGNGGDGVGNYAPETGFGIRTADQARRQIERSMEILGVDHLEMYQLWACHGDAVFAEAVRPGGFLEGVLAAHAEGLFDFIGMTTHSGSADIIRYWSESPYPFDMVTLPFHLLDTSRLEAVRFLREQGVGVVAMNPLAGGRFGHPSPLLRAIAEEQGCASFVETALRFVAGTPGITTALCGLTDAAQVEEGARAVERGPLTDAAAAAVTARVRELYASVQHLCNGCGYCGECSEGILIPEVLAIYSGLLLPSMAEDEAKRLAERLAAGAVGLEPGRCTGCRECEARCPSRLPIAELMQRAAENWPYPGAW